MAEIKVLDQNTINQIAAGEVIERPSSVVKELVENALDAGATAVTVEIRDGGVSLIRVTDNGGGIPSDQIRVAFLRHSTSKIRRAQDLLTISSLGFRGEALSSIASVARVELITRTPDSLTGTRYCIEGGEEKSFEDVGAPCGTTFLVKDLFFNTPARRKFLKTAATEASYISSLTEHLALSHPDVSFRLLINNQTRLHTAGNHNLKDIIYTVYGREITSAIVPVKAENEDIRLGGFIGRPEINRGNRSFEIFFINGRYVRSALITRALENAYHGYVMQHKYPFAVLHMEIDSAFLDVNVHPTKMELRFRNEEEVYQTVYDAVRNALTGRELIPTNTFREETPEDKAPVPSPRGAESFETNRRQHEPFSGVPASAYEPEKRPASAFVGQRPTSSAAAEHPVSADVPDRQIPFSAAARQTPASTVREKIAYEPSTIEKMQASIRNSLLGNRQVREENQGIPSAAADSFVPASDPFNVDSSAPVSDTVNVNSSDPVSDTVNVGPSAPVSEVPGTEAASASLPTESDHTEPVQTPAVPKPKQLDFFEEKLLTAETRAEYRLIGQLFDTYWLIQYRDNFLIMDQHAAHEKVLYEKTMKTLADKEFTSQEVQPPILLTLNAREQQILREYAERFEKFGFRIEPFGGSEYAVYAVPANMFGLARRDLLIEMIDTLADESGHTEMTMIDEKIALMSCKAAVKGNNHLSFAEAEALLDQLMKLDNPYMCPHGRPTIITMSKYELEKKFKRVIS